MFIHGELGISNVTEIVAEYRQTCRIKNNFLGETNDFDVPEHHSAPLLHTKSFWNFIVNMPPCVVFVSPGLFLVAILKLCLLSKLQRLK